MAKLKQYALMHECRFADPLVLLLLLLLLLKQSDVCLKAFMFCLCPVFTNQPLISDTVQRRPITSLSGLGLAQKKLTQTFRPLLP